MRPRVSEPKEQYISLRGGLDLTTPIYQMDPGRMVDCMNYEVTSGGYAPVDGYERVDGNGIPSAAQFQVIAFNGTIAPDTAIIEDDLIAYFLTEDKGNATFYIQKGELKTGDAFTGFTVENAFLFDEAPHGFFKDINLQELAVEKKRSLVEKVPGDGSVLGVWQFKGKLYAFRDNVEHTECFLYKATPDGWKKINTPTLLPGGKYQFINTNFLGSADTMSVFGCDGVNKAFQFDGETFTQITTGMDDDAPIAIVAHKKQLFLAFRGGSLQHSAPTDPTGKWTVVTGAGELGMGEEIQDLANLPGGALGIFCKYSIHILYGNSVGDWQLKAHTLKAGATAGTVQDCGNIFYFEGGSVFKFSASQVYGDFVTASVSRQIGDFLKSFADIECLSVRVSEKGQYRLFFANGVCITMSTLGKGTAFTQSQYKDVPRCISAPQRAGGEEGSIYFGSDNGFVFKMDSGHSFDEMPMFAYFTLPPNPQGLPRYKKRYREVAVIAEYNAKYEADLGFIPNFRFRYSDVPLSPQTKLHTYWESGSLWDIAKWNQFKWNKESGEGGRIGAGRLEGVSTEVGLMISFKAESTCQGSPALEGLFIYYSVLGRQR